MSGPDYPYDQHIEDMGNEDFPPIPDEPYIPEGATEEDPFE